MVDNVERGMTSLPLDCTHGRTTSGVACNHRLWAAQAVGRHRAWHAILALGRQTWSNDVGRGMPSLPLGSTGGQTASGVACHHRLCPAHKVERRWAWNAIIVFGQHTRSNDVRRGMPLSPLGNTHGRTTSGVACHLTSGLHTRSNDVGRGMISPPLDSTHGRQRRAWHDITALGLHTRSATSGMACHHRFWTS